MTSGVQKLDLYLASSLHMLFACLLNIRTLITLHKLEFMKKIELKVFLKFSLNQNVISALLQLDNVHTQIWLECNFLYLKAVHAGCPHKHGGAIEWRLRDCL